MNIFRVLNFAFVACLSLNLVLIPFSVRVSAIEYLFVEKPDVVVARIKNNGKITETPALFGMPDYRVEKRAILVYAPIGNRDACLPITNIDAVSAPYWHSLFPSDSHGGEAISRPVFLLVDRGGCTFTTKVRNAQNAKNGNVITVLVADDGDSTAGLPYMQDDGHGKDLQLSSLMITKESGITLKQYLQDQETDVLSPGATVRVPIVLHVQYSVPNPDGRVEYELWTTSIEDHSLPFKTAFGEAARSLGMDRAVLTPHYFTVDGEEWGCKVPIGSPSPCGNQCLDGGKYCAADPEKDPINGFSGAMIVSENVRQLCLWKYIQPDKDVLNADNSVLVDGVPPFNQPLLWFDYVEQLAGACKTNITWNTPACSYGVLQNLDSTVPGLSTKVKSCYEQSMADLSAGNPIAILKDEMTKQTASGIFVLPQAFVNKRPYYGSLNCPSPVLPASCSLLSMICAGYAIDDPKNPLPDLCKIKAAEEVVNTTTSSGSSIGAVIGIVIAFGVVAGIAVYLYMKKQNMAMRDDIDSLLKQYLPLEGGGGVAANDKHHSTSNGNGTSSISLGSLTSSGITPGKKRATGQDAHRLIGQGTLDEEDVQL